MNDSYFVSHEPCPRCGSRNNLGVWSDGHKWCFGCRYYVPSPASIENIKKKVMSQTSEKNEQAHVFDPSDYTYSIPHAALSWLGKYGVTKAELVHFSIMWNKKEDRLVFPIIINDKVVLTSERYFGTEPLAPKYVVNGQKNKNNLFITHPKSKDTVVFVEDFVSAIKVARFTGACPLLGCTISPNALKWAVERFKQVRVWLDMDKAVQSLHEAAKASQFVPDTRSIITDLDPKEYTNSELMEILKKYGVQ